MGRITLHGAYAQTLVTSEGTLIVDTRTAEVICYCGRRWHPLRSEWELAGMDLEGILEEDRFWAMVGADRT